MPSCWPWSIADGEGHSRPTGKEIFTENRMGFWVFCFAFPLSTRELSLSKYKYVDFHFSPLLSSRNLFVSLAYPQVKKAGECTFTPRGRDVPSSRRSTIKLCLSNKNIARIAGVAHGHAADEKFCGLATVLSIGNGGRVGALRHWGKRAKPYSCQQ